MYQKICLISACFLGCICSAAVAGDTWTITPILIDGQPVLGSQTCALAMRSDRTWPVVSYSMSVAGGTEDRTAALTPVGWQAGPTTAGGNIGAATSNNGTAAFTYGNGAVLMLGQTGWSTSYNSYGSIRPSIAFQNNNNPAVLCTGGAAGASGFLTLALFNGSGWSQEFVANTQYPRFMPTDYGLAFDSYNQANVAFVRGGQLMYGLKGALTQNQWGISAVDNVHPDAPNIDVAIGAGDIPWIAYRQSNYLRYATYNVQQQGWVSGLIGQTAGPGAINFFSMASDGRGGIGIAYVGINNMLSFAYNDGSGFWTNDGIAQTSNSRSVALEFDAHNDPVICYTDVSGGLSLAYGPIIVPEPASSVIIALGAALIASKRKFIHRGGRR
jgi:hypothetical protein